MWAIGMGDFTIAATYTTLRDAFALILSSVYTIKRLGDLNAARMECNQVQR